MSKIKISELESLISALFEKAGLHKRHCQQITDVFMRTTYRGVGHHDIYSLPGRINNLQKDRINNTPDMKKLADFNSMEVYDGDNGPGEINCYFITERSQKLADQNGISLVSIKNSNHFLAAAPYVELSAEKGYLSLIFSSAGISMGVGESPKVIGNGPFGYAVQGQNHNVLFDICMAYSSYGKLHAKAEAGEKVPSYWGKDSEGNHTEDPAEILEGGIPLAMGEHKGFGLSMMVEFITSILADGDIALEKNKKSTGIYTHSIITIKPEGVNDSYVNNVDKLIDDMKTIYPDLHIPGDSSYGSKKEIEKKGYFEIEKSLLDRLLELKEDL